MSKIDKLLKLVEEDNYEVFDIPMHVLRYLNSRKDGDIQDAKEQRKILKSHLGDDFEKVMMKHGDPDKSGNFEKVYSAWERE